MTRVIDLTRSNKMVSFNYMIEKVSKWIKSLKKKR